MKSWHATSRDYFSPEAGPQPTGVLYLPVVGRSQVAMGGVLAVVYLAEHLSASIGRILSSVRPAKQPVTQATKERRRNIGDDTHARQIGRKKSRGGATRQAMVEEGSAKYKLKRLYDGPHEISLPDGTGFEKGRPSSSVIMKFHAFVLLATFALAAGQTFENCLEKDSIACVQKNLYRKAKEFFDSDNVEIFSGVSLVKSGDSQGRGSRSGKELMYDQEIDGASNVADRQNALMDFVSAEAGEFLTGRSLKINFTPIIERIGSSARAISDSAPEEVRQAVDLVVEGRGKKKQLKQLLPLLLAAKAKIGALATLGYFVTGFIAKKAIVVSLISLAISAFIGFKALWAKGGHDLTPYHGGWSSGPATSGGWSAPVPSGGWSSGGSWDDGHASYAQNQAYSGYHH
ncbi:DUF1676 domain-containing protein Osi6 [Calliopsis andreniformis]|uniref:DUF1676 domain-containing protein Osi6 n=1 Tax=Calliopsis andreniformis TaxID=337506 RepID=UPI003FCCAE8D